MDFELYTKPKKDVINRNIKPRFVSRIEMQYKFNVIPHTKIISVFTIIYNILWTKLSNYDLLHCFLSNFHHCFHENVANFRCYYEIFAPQVQNEMENIYIWCLIIFSSSFYCSSTYILYLNFFQNTFKSFSSSKLSVRIIKRTCFILEICLYWLSLFIICMLLY